jgi:putative membrane protein
MDMRRAYIAVVLAGLVAGCATDGHRGIGTAAPDAQEIEGSGHMLASADCDFARAVCHSTIAQIELGQLAARNSQDPEIRKLARSLVDNRVERMPELRRLCARKGVPADTELAYSFQLSLERLAGLADADFDRAFKEQVVQQNEAAIELFEKQRCEGIDRELKSFAERYLPQLCEELAAARALEIADYTSHAQPGSQRPVLSQHSR